MNRSLLMRNFLHQTEAKFPNQTIQYGRGEFRFRGTEIREQSLVDSDVIRQLGEGRTGGHHGATDVREKTGLL
jgi:hypothetical protein